MSSASTSQTGPRTYRGLNNREQTGWVLGVTPMQAFVCVVLAVPVLIALAAGDYRQALVWLGISGPLAMLVVVPVRGRPALRWLGDLLLFQLGVLSGWSVFQSRAATGSPGPAAEPDLPGVLTRLRFPDGPVFSDRGRICLIHDTAEGRWGATAQLTHTGTGMLSAAECDQLAARLGSLLSSIGHRDVVDRLSLYVRTVPDDATEYQMWRARHTRPGAPELAHRATTELDATIGSVSLRTELFVCVSGQRGRAAPPGRGRRGGVTGRALALYRALDGIEDGLKPLGVRQVTWLTSAAMASALRTGYNPATAAALAGERLRNHTEAAGCRWRRPGRPSRPPPPRGRITTTGSPRVSYAVLMPENGLTFGALGPLLAVRTAGERRTRGDPLRGLSARASARAVQRQRFRTGIVREVKSSRGFATTAADQRSSVGARDQEYAVAAGAALVRFAVAASVTVPSSWPVEDHAARLENDAAGRARLLRLELAQDSAFVAACCRSGSGCRASAEPCHDRRADPPGGGGDRVGPHRRRPAARPARLARRRGGAPRRAGPLQRGPRRGGALRRGRRASRRHRERVNRPASRRGHRARGAGWAAVDAIRRWPVYQAPSTEVGGLFPLLAANPLPAVGARMGYDALSGSAFYCHPIEWVLRGLATNPNLVLFGEPGRGKSSTVVALILRMMLFGTKTLIAGDVKGEYTPLLRALGVTPIALGRGSRARLNALDLGPLAGRWSSWPVARQREELAGVIGRWTKLLAALAETQGYRPSVTDEAVLSAVIRRPGRRRPTATPRCGR